MEENGILFSEENGYGHSITLLFIFSEKSIDTEKFPYRELSSIDRRYLDRLPPTDPNEFSRDDDNNKQCIYIFALFAHSLLMYYNHKSYVMCQIILYLQVSQWKIPAARAKCKTGRRRGLI